MPACGSVTAIDKDMVAVRISPDMRMSVAASPDYLRGKTAARKAAGPDRPPLREPAPADARQPVRLGFRERKKVGQREGRWPDDLQQHDS